MPGNSLTSRRCHATWCFPGRSAVSGWAKVLLAQLAAARQSYDPTCTEFVGKGTTTARKTLTGQVWEDLEPYRGITSESRFQLGAVRNLGPELTLDRLDGRRTLLEQIEQFRRNTDAPASGSGIERHRAMAYDLLGSERLRQAFDLGLEPDETRNLYGMTLFGQASSSASGVG